MLGTTERNELDQHVRVVKLLTVAQFTIVLWAVRIQQQRFGSYALSCEVMQQRRTVSPCTHRSLVLKELLVSISLWLCLSCIPYVQKSWRELAIDGHRPGTEGTMKFLPLFLN